MLNALRGGHAARGGRLARILGRSAAGDTRRVAVNSAIQLAGRMIALAAGIATSVALGRHLGPDVYGQYVYAITYLGLFVVLSSFGLDTLAVRDLAISPDRTDAILSTVLTLRIGLAALSIPLALLSLLLTEPTTELRVLIALTSPILLTSALGVVGAVFGARLETQYRVVGELVQPLLFVAAALAIVATGRGIVAVVVAYVLSYVASSLAMLALSRRFARPRLRLEGAYARRLIAASIPLGLAAVFYQLYYRVDILILDSLQGSSAVGIYGVAYGFFGQAPAFFSLIATSLFPVLVGQAQRGSAALAATIRRSAAMAAGLGIAATLATSLAAPRLLELMYGHAYDGAGSALAVLGLALPFSFCTYVVNYAMVALDRHQTIWRVNAAAALLNVALNWLLVPGLSYLGSAYATVATEAFVCLTQVAILRWQLARRPEAVR
jgi:PST family polysaccharide transporter